jgi:hypothetical protein
MFTFRFALCALLLGSVLFLQSCAAMFTGTTSSILVDSEPRGIPFSIGDVRGVTPQNVEISKKMKEITFEPRGTEPVTRKLERKFQGGMLLMDILFTPGYGLVGILVDGGTAAWYKHSPSVFFRSDENVASVSEASSGASIQP